MSRSSRWREARPSVRTASDGCTHAARRAKHGRPHGESESAVSAYRNTTDDRWSQLSRQELIALGKTIVGERLESLGCTVKTPSTRIGGKLDVRTPSERSLEVFVSTQRVGGYVFWAKRRLQPASNRFAAIVLLADAEDPDLYLVPSTEWRSASPPLTDRDNVGKQSEPEYGISLARSSLSALQRYTWDEAVRMDYFR